MRQEYSNVIFSSNSDGEDSDYEIYNC